MRFALSVAILAVAGFVGFSQGLPASPAQAPTRASAQPEQMPDEIRADTPSIRHRGQAIVAGVVGRGMVKRTSGPKRKPRASLAWYT